ncbi:MULTISPECIES: methionine--tRNA ligase [unclassified Ruminococcus]|uniref:methionine--tRNA ligase n=1 Tax=unclassified Ruminococcus TaxID=2608920 RepID=UPI00210EF19E|nr:MULTISPECIES: methionine--tRNA ligase [unclassified Ruminococcus]MCQ4022161.1 methionine--tRNA ligase [Ruminococcus sp. zg-924]MCQ4115559.1 methionine--tRNA ligase [Ruminococcus sp. zg-921]
MCKKEPFYITTPIYYPSGNPHIGHCYTTVACDSIARYRRMQGYDVMFLTGTDEHGLKIEQKAAEKGITPKQYVDEIVEIFKNLWQFMNISYDRYIRTTDDYHVETVQKIFKELYDKGYIYKGEYKGKYCTPCESFWTDSQLVDGKCPECGREVVEAKEEAYFLRMSPFADRVEKLLTETDYLQPKTRAVELVNNFIKPGLEDLCVSRTSFKWGIPVTFDEKHVVYVWIDALSNYISALGFYNDKYNDFEKFWPANVHMVAKDIMRFHAIIWPAMLMALDLPLPKHLAVHGWITFNGQKMSKSLGNVVDPLILGERYGADAIRYHILREMALGADSSFSNEIMINRINSDLANGLGNLVSRTVAMVEKYFGGTLPTERESGDFDDELIECATALSASVDDYMDKTQLNNALAEIFKVVSRANKYIDETMPWVIAKDESKKARLATVLYNLLDTIRIVATLLSAFMPTTMPKAIEQIGGCEKCASYENADKFGVLPLDVTVKKGEALFPRIDVDKEIEELNSIIKNSESAKEQKEEKKVKIEGLAQIGIDDFAKVELRVAKIVDCEPVKKAKKLLKLTLDDGEGERIVASGIAKFYTPDELKGKKIILVANLKPAVLCGVESCGMILASDDGDGGVKVIFVDDSIPCGCKIR